MESMKNFFAIMAAAFVLLLPLPAAAAATRTTGQIPEQHDLQPPPAGMKANISHNIQDNATAEAAAGAGDTTSANPTGNNIDDGAPAGGQPATAASGSAASVPANSATRLVVIIVLLAGIAGYVYFRLRRSANKPGA